MVRTNAVKDVPVTLDSEEVGGGRDLLCRHERGEVGKMREEELGEGLEFWLAVGCEGARGVN